MYKMYDVDIEDLTQEEIQELFLKHDESNLWPIKGRFNVTEKAIQNLKQFEELGGVLNDGLEYALALDNEISKIVNSEV